MTNFQPTRICMEQPEGCVQPRSIAQMLSYGVGAVAAAVAVLGAGATIYASSQASKAQAKASAQQAQSQKDANNTNLQMYEESRGSTGSAVLPTYLNNSDGSLFEGKLGTDLVSAYNGSDVPLSTFQSAVSPFLPAQDKATSFTNDIFNGGVTSKLLAQAQPVQQARVSSAMDSLNKTLASIDAAQAGKGFSGDAYGNRLLQFQGREAAGNAGVANLAENQQIKNYGDVTLPMNNLNLPASMAAGNAQMSFLPQNSYLSSIQSRMQPFNFIKIGQGTPPAVQPLPTPPPGLSTGAAIAGGVSQLAGVGLNYYLGQQQQQNQLAQIKAIYGGGSGYGGGSPGTSPVGAAAGYNPAYDMTTGVYGPASQASPAITALGGMAG